MNHLIPYIVADPKNRVWDSCEYAGRTSLVRGAYSPGQRAYHPPITLGVRPAYAGRTQPDSKTHACHACMGPVFHLYHNEL